MMSISMISRVPSTEELYISEYISQLTEYIHILANTTYIREYISQLTVY